jgi:phosphoribosyl-AMP cyclohydrolase
MKMTEAIAQKVLDLFKDPNDLVPTIAQDAKTGEVLMLAYMNMESLQVSLKTGRATYWSRSRQELWEKGLTSGHTQFIHSVSIDCDGDALLIKVDQMGAPCHTGQATCFYRSLDFTQDLSPRESSGNPDL